MKAYVIAEAGSCHDGDFRKASALVRAAAKAGADAVKFQFYSNFAELASRRKVPDSYREIYRRYQMPVYWLDALASEARQQKIHFMASTYLPQDVAVVAPHVRHFKVASFEADARDLLRAHLPYVSDTRWLIISTGMIDSSQPSALGPIAMGEELNVLAAALRTLYCVSAYPAPVEALRLTNVRAHDGFSDHSNPAHVWTGALALAASISDPTFIIEAHLKLEETAADNPDAPHAMTPDQFNRYVANIRFAERCFQPGEGPHACEADMAQYRVTVP